MVWTNKQIQAIETHDRNVLVSAAAGSGKTSVLTERILRLVTSEEKRVPLKELLVVTFTDAAANEMKSRIGAALTLAAENDPFAETQLRQLGSAKIMTFHAFCLTVLRKYFYMIDLDPSFSIADEKRAAALREEAIEEVFTAAFADNDEEFRSSFTEFLLRYSGERDERKASDKVLKVFDFIMTLPEPFDWLEKNIAALSVPAENSTAPAFLSVNAEIAHRLKLGRYLTEQTGELLVSNGLDGLAEKNAADLEAVTQIERLFLDGEMEKCRDALEELSFERFVAKKYEKEDYESIKPLVQLRRDRVKAIMKEEPGVGFFTLPSGLYEGEIREILPFATMLGELVKRFNEEYSRIKRGESVIDYADFEHMALKILDDESIADDYKRRFSYIFIDEYQDSNYVQDALISRISRGANVFMVGDVKQSIYMFRNATPEIFLKKYNDYPIVKEEGGTELRLDLSKNFRSKSGVIDAVNAVFKTVMESHYSGMDYDENAQLERGIEYEPEWEGKTNVHLVRKDKDKEQFDNYIWGEAALCARIIQETVGKLFFDAKLEKERPVQYGDVAILLRDAKNTADVYRRTLEACGIPAVADRGEGYFETIEIDTFLAFLRAVVNLRRDVPLAASMCSAVFGFELSELAEIRADNRDGFFYTAFLSYAEKGDDEALRGKCAGTAARLARWRDEERFMRLDDFLLKLMRESGFYDYASALPRGAQRRANLRALLDRAAEYQSGRVEGLRGFLAYLDRIKRRGGVEQISLTEGGEDVCRIMTIHKSKGKEFPVVLLAGLGKAFSQGGRRDDSLLLHRDAGLSLHMVDPAAHTYKKTQLHSALKLRQEVDGRAEIIRLLYVGMTRAMDTLHLIGTDGDPGGLVELYKTKGAAPKIDTDIFGAANYLQLILPTAVQHKKLFNVQVVDSEAIVDLDADKDAFARASVRGVSAPLAHELWAAKHRPSASLDRNQSSSSLGRDTPLRVCRVRSRIPVRIAKRKAKGNHRLLAENTESPGFVYPFEAAEKLKSKYSVTELSKSPDEEAPVFFMAGGAGESDEDAGLTAAERGTALHKAFEALDFKEAYARRGDRAWFETYVNGLAGSGLLSGIEAEAADADTLLRFAGSDLLARAAASDFVLKEAAFNMKVPYSETERGKNDKDGIGEEIIVQGVIDCLFFEENGIVLVDYKTGWFDVSAYESEAERIRAVYGEQLRLYSRAAGLIFKKPVKECVIYMSRSGVTIDLI